MSWVVSVTPHDGEQKFLVLTSDGGFEHVGVELLTIRGVPSAQSTVRIAYTGEISSWHEAPADEFLQAFDIALPTGLSNQHAVFRSQMTDGTTVLVPALVLIRGLFRPHRSLLPLAFTPSNVDMLAFLDYAQSPPEVVLDAELEGPDSRYQSDMRFEFLRWFHSSHTARLCAQSVYDRSLAGALSMQLPKGVFRMALHGVKRGTIFCVTKLSVTSVTVPHEDSITNGEQAFVFHGMAATERKASSAPNAMLVPLHEGRDVALTDEEWRKLEPLFERGRGDFRQRYCRRRLLDAILRKLSGTESWKSVQEAFGFDKTTLTMTFRRWQLDGRLSRALTALARIRDGAAS